MRWLRSTTCRAGLGFGAALLMMAPTVAACGGSAGEGVAASPVVTAEASVSAAPTPSPTALPSEPTSPSASATPTPTPVAPVAELPGGGHVMFPGRRLVALYGHPGAPSLGVLGEQGLDASVARARDLAEEYAPLSDVPVVPAFEIIATVAHRSPGGDGNYSGETSAAKLRPWIETAAEAGVYVILDLQPGRADPLDQAKLYADLLAFPNVGLAIDAEWALGRNQLPLKQIGSLDAAVFNRVGAWLDAFTARHHLPQKVFVLHQFRLSMIADEANLSVDYDNVAVLIHMDGQGSTPNKMHTWQAVTAAAPAGVRFGWKNFYDEDQPMLTPSQTMAVRPAPVMISYQ